MRSPGNREPWAHGCWQTRDQMHNRRPPWLCCTINGQWEPRKNVYILVRPRARCEWAYTTVHRPELRRQRTSWRQSPTKSHRRQTRDCKRTNTSMTMSPLPPSWRSAGTGPPPRGRQPHPRCGTWYKNNRLATSARNAASMSHQAHLCRNYAAFGEPPRGRVMQEISQWR